MSSTVETHNARAAEPARSKTPKYKLSFLGVLRSEALKFRTLVSSWVLMIITALIMIGFAALTAVQAMDYADSLHDAMTKGKEIPQYYLQLGDPAEFARQAVDSGYVFGYIILASMAVVFIASEFGTKSVISTLTAAPKRGMVYVAKTVQITLIAAITAIVSGVLAWAVSQWVLSTSDMNITFGLFEEQTLMNILGLILVFVLTAWMGIGIGAIIRNNAGAIVILVVLLFILPLLLMPFQWEWVRDFQSYIPSALTANLTNPLEPMQDPKYVASGAWYAVWCVVPLILGYFSFTQRDPK
ncbi:ABC transporter permease subunit [Rothia uropygioeca]|uniref:ABC transporter permease subunit n=1 Tax=Kocuria sp. 257 TaxID=2021970 RepID=UPI0010136D9E|nr:ABC transporter permease subunit [Kocuria sp. 257]